ncbi:MAG: hypothetical protein IIB45_05025 [Candidatus Marinimicrobia bacterium]|nr:hypothetical protein [Candidatus Neomarinimicrobiota bacterium]
MRTLVLLLPLFLIGQTMTVYKDNIALVKVPVQWNVPSGISEITYDKLPIGLIPDSPFLMLEDVVIRYQRFNNDVFNGEKYFRGKIGAHVYVKVYDDKIHEGTLIEFSGSSISLKTRKEIMTISRNKVDYMYSRDSESKPQLRPELAWDIYMSKIPRTDSINGNLVYLSTGFDWNAVYRFILNGKKGELISEAVVSNASNMDFYQYSLKLVEGNLQKKGRRPQPVYRTKSRTSALEIAPVATEKELGDFHIYSLPEKIDLKQNQSVTVRLYEPRKVNFIKTYVFKNSERSKKEEPLQIEIQLANTEENGLNIPLPRGKITLYLQSPDGSLEYAGEDELKQIPKGETATISGGRAFDVIGKRIVLHYDRKRKSEEASIEIIVKNIKNAAVNIRLEERIHGDWIIRNASDNYIKKDASTIYFPFTVEAGGSKTVTYTYRKEWK